ncbi:hypothetical protein [Flavivirga jejuensis]|uniref:Uncharacterized protein n=1 Tax=Flavivirga jejuensis TaxID=870487 RepID=A0ABT8WSR2_9FLAO|nr:hypothetical protein [Flavivirga jejuensis]MDO5976232.1 hypothetical protein [Flavivirga jejuensis]
MKKIILIGLIILDAFTSESIVAQAIVLDDLVEAGDLKLFPNIYNKNEYYYLADKVRLARGENGKPEFSFIRWVENVSTDDNEESYKDTEGAGGGIVTALIELSVSDEQKMEAQQELRRINPKGKIKGPVMYRGGTVALVSTFNAGNEEFTKQVLGMGAAPVLEGQKIPVSMLLTRKGAKTLWESFKANIADLSFTFNMEIEGYNAPISANVSFKWEEIYKHNNFQGGIATPVLAAEVDVAVSEMISNRVIKITEVGEDEDFDQIRNVVMEMIQTGIFESQENTSAPSLSQLTSNANGRPSMLDRASTMLSQQRRDHERDRSRANRPVRTSVPSTRNSPSTSSDRDNDENDTASTSDSTTPTAGVAVRRASPSDEPSTVPPYEPSSSNTDSASSAPVIAIAAAFQFKKEKKSGSVTINMEKSIMRNQPQNFGGNIGVVNCKDCFRMFNMDDPLYKQREIIAFIDGANLSDFGQFINYISVLLKKKHQSGNVTQREIRIDRKNFNRGNNFKFEPYGWKGDNNRSKWLEYEYKATWSFHGGHEVSTPWTTREAGAITLAPPFKKKDIYINVDESIVDDNLVRFAEVKVFYKQGDKEKRKSIRVDFSKDDLSQRVSIILEEDILEYDYQIKWILKGQDPIVEERKSSTDETIYLINSGQF